MFMGTLTGPFFSHLIGSSSAGFTDLILTEERIEAGIKAGKIEKLHLLMLIKSLTVGRKSPMLRTVKRVIVTNT